MLFVRENVAGMSCLTVRHVYDVVTLILSYCIIES